MNRAPRIIAVDTKKNERHPGTAVFLTQLVRFQRRLSVLVFRRYAPPLAVGAIVATEAAIVAFHPTIWQATFWTGGAVAFGMAIAGIVALVRTPSLQATAATVDRRLRLEDRIVTALQFASDADGMSPLVVADASDRLATHTPMTLAADAPLRLRWMTAGCVAVPLLFALAIGRAPLALQANTSEQAATGAAGVQGGTPQPSPGTIPTAARAEAESSGSMGPAQVAPNGPADHVRQQTMVTSPSPNPGVLSGSSTFPRNDSAGSQPGGTRGDIRREPRSSAGAGRGAGTDGPSQAGGDSGDHGSGAGGGATAGNETGSGGVRGGMPSPPTSQPTARLLPDGLDYAAQYRKARVRTEAAIAQERVPARLRTYVRVYFLAIQPAGRQ